MGFGRLAPPTLVVLLLLTAGCGPKDEEITEAPSGALVAFEGKPDAAYVGKYKTADGHGSYTLGADGSFELKSKVSTPGGAIDQNVKGAWAVNGDRFLFKYGEGNVVPYAFKKEGDKLKLTLTGSMKRETVLVKQ